MRIELKCRKREPKNGNSTNGHADVFDTPPLFESASTHFADLRKMRNDDKMKMQQRKILSEGKEKEKMIATNDS